MDQANQPMTPPKVSLPGFIELMKLTKDLVLKRWQFFFILAALPSAIGFVVALMGQAPEGVALGLITLLTFIQAVVGLFSAVAIVIGLGDESLNDVVRAFKLSFKSVAGVIWAGFLAGLVASLGFILLIIPGIYLSLSYSFVMFVVVLEGVKGWPAAKRSKALFKRNSLAVFGRYVAFYVVLLVVFSIFAAIVGATQNNFLLAFLPAVFGTIITPFATAYIYLIYKALAASKA